MAKYPTVALQAAMKGPKPSPTLGMGPGKYVKAKTPGKPNPEPFNMITGPNRTRGVLKTG